MSQDMLLQLTRQTFLTAAMLVAPILLVTLAVGVIVGIIQAVTSIQEQTLVFIPKMFAVMITLFFTLPWMLRVILDFTLQFFEHMQNIAK